MLVICFISQWIKDQNMDSSFSCLRKNPNKSTEKALFNWPIVLQYDVKAKYRLVSRKFFGHKVCSPERSLNQPKATRVCIRSTNQSNHSDLFPFVCCVRFVHVFSFQGHTKIALTLILSFTFNTMSKELPLLLLPK